jgi:hypothetical protein
MCNRHGAFDAGSSPTLEAVGPSTLVAVLQRKVFEPKLLPMKKVKEIGGIK